MQISALLSTSPYQFHSQTICKRRLNFVFFLNQCHLEDEVTTTSFSFYRCTTWTNADFLVSSIVFTCLCQIFAVSSPSADRQTICLQIELRADKSQCAPHFQITYSLSFSVSLRPRKNMVFRHISRDRASAVSCFRPY